MSKREETGLATSAGLIRYMDETFSKIKVKPEYVIGVTVAFIIIEIFLNYGMFL
ncbi:preprotein translocase subunit Sec61beta [Methanocaldococcus sp.]|uniref:preprotein translocase subunit Sec61beta n=1 Tax=Methanocaldococcus sp. TaxID=2152917 RepID=UPI00262082E5|nr:preprotein translocase subunit Sec61beta [Methanocaldococcus sp.]MCQ6253722.1 preprotein translocase subunit Sec61beta [Methanocaldococcus sp.]